MQYIVGKSAMDQYNSPGFSESVKTRLQAYARMCPCRAGGLIETLDGERPRFLGVLHHAALDPEEVIRMLYKATNQKSEGQSTGTLIARIPAFSEVKHSLVTQNCDGASPALLQEHFALLSAALTNCLEHFTVTHEVLNLYTSVNAGDLARLYGHSQANTFLAMGEDIHHLRDCMKRDPSAMPLLIESLEKTIKRSRASLEGFREAVFRTDNPVEIDEVLDNLRGFAEFLRVVDVMSVEMDPSLQGSTVCGVAQMVLSTMLKNSQEALIAVEDVTPAITLRVSPSADRTSAVFTHTDNGVGMSDQMKDRLFFPFASEKGHKRGLGLYLSKRLAEALGGSLRLNYSSPERGSMFTLLLPMRKSAKSLRQRRT